MNSLTQRRESVSGASHKKFRIIMKEGLVFFAGKKKIVRVCKHVQISISAFFVEVEIAQWACDKGCPSPTELSYSEQDYSDSDY